MRSPGVARDVAATRSDESSPPLVKMPNGTSDISSRFTARTSVSRSSAVLASDSVAGRLAASAALQYERIWVRPRSAMSRDAGGSL